MKKDSLFNESHFYRRSDIHDRYGGTRQGGIAASAAYPYIFIFSGDAGHQHGYIDQWVNENVFSYTGEGQVDDMRFIRGNLALRDHMKNGRRVFLFIYKSKGIVKFEGELELITIDFFQTDDRDGKKRNAIKFFLKKIGLSLNYPVDQLKPSITAEGSLALGNNIPNETERKGLVTSRVGQGAYRKSILFRWEFRCAVTNYSKERVLIASHIVPWRDSSNNERLDVNNGILLSPTYDALFDQRLISFENNGKIILSDNLRKTDYTLIGVTGKETIKRLSYGNIPYLERHRESLA